jgi:hypothetical protein
VIVIVALICDCDFDILHQKAEQVQRTEAERLIGVEKSRVSFLESRVAELTHDNRVVRDV